MTKKELMAKRIKEHGMNLIAVFNLPADTDPVKLCKQLMRIETAGHRAATCLCNTNTLNLLELNRWTGYDIHQTTEEEQEKFFNALHRRLEKIIPNHKGVFFNFDPRGYFLKANLTPDQTLFRDLGSYGVLAPDLR